MESRANSPGCIGLDTGGIGPICHQAEVRNHKGLRKTGNAEGGLRYVAVWRSLRSVAGLNTAKRLREGKAHSSFYFQDTVRH